MKKLSILLCLIVLGWSSRAQIIHHDIVPDSTIGGGPVLSFWVMQPPTSIAQLHIFWSMNNSVYLRVHGAFGHGEILMNAGYPARLSAGNEITPTSATWVEPTSATGSLHEEGNGNWRSDATDKYLGFRFKSSAGAWNYGWLKMTVAAGATSFTVKEWAYQSTPGTGIRAGETSATGIAPIENAPWIRISVLNEHIYPLQLEDGVDYAYRITDMQGRRISSGKIRANGSIAISGLASGLYVFRIASNKYEQRLKFLVPKT